MTIAELTQYAVFFVFATMLVATSVMVVIARNPVRSVLFLVWAFFSSAVLWLLLQAEFLALILIFVYVGAVMTLFLFVVMMMNVTTATDEHRFVRYLPLGIIALAVLVGLMVVAILPEHFGVVADPSKLDAFSSAKALGRVLYTQHVYSFELAGVILLVAIIAAISLAFRGPRKRRLQSPHHQVKVTASDRLTLVSMPAEKQPKE